MRNLAIQSLTLTIFACLSLPALGQETEPKPDRHQLIPSKKFDDLFDALPESTPNPARNQQWPAAESSGTPIQLRDKRTRSTPRPQPQIDNQPLLPPADNLQLQEQSIVTMHSQVQQLRQQLLVAHKALAMQRPKNFPPLENGKLHAYRLRHIDPKLLAETLESFLGTNQLRLVPVTENKILLTYCSDEMSKQIDQLVETLDAKDEPIAAAAFTPTEETQSLQVRIFWLADEVGNSMAEDYLPEAVIEAVRRLGLKNPQLVSQSASSVAGKPGGDSNFQFNFPATIGNETLQFASDCDMFLEDQPFLEIEIQVSIQGSQPIVLAGKLSAPLGHYMVLGTTNYAAGGHVARGGGAAISGGGRGGGGGFGIGGGGGFGGGSVTVEDSSEPAPKPTTSRFAFVVQVVEAESFAPTEEQLGILSAPENR